MSDDELAPIDHLFAKRFTEDPEAHRFLAHLLRSAREGHLCLSDLSFAEGAEKLGECPAVVEADGRWYLRRNWECEQRFLEEWQRLKAHPPRLTISQKALAARLEDEMLEPEQREAILRAARDSVTLICGGPGTGKTYTAALLIRHFRELTRGEMVIGAPTGKAAANLRRTIGGRVSTLHSLLHKQLIQCADTLVIDEGSMIDAQLMERLFTQVKSGARLILLGDRDQLPPVESGNFFADMARESALLGRCLRAELQEIVDLAAAVKRGEMIPHQPLRKVKPLLKERVFDQGYRVLCPLRRGPYGVDALNHWLYKEDLKRGGEQIPIMITVNDPAQELYNGDVGILQRARQIARFDDEREIPEHLLPPYDYAYLLSVHKSQGSEYDKVLILLPEGSEKFGREVLYTAITRAKKRVELLADSTTLEALLAKQTYRLSGI